MKYPKLCPVGTLSDDERETMRMVSAMLNECQKCTGTMEHDMIAGAFSLICEKLRCEQTTAELTAERIAYHKGLGNV